METDDFAPISGLLHLTYCERRCALIHVEGLWAENVYTAEGRIQHEKADLPGAESYPGGKLARGLWLRSERLKLYGRADVVEFSSKSGRITAAYPVEYKRGRKRPEPGSIVQLCAQAMCLEEMLGLDIPAGAIFFGRSRRRLEVEFSPKLREETESATARLHELIALALTPPASFSKKCPDCSLIDLCQPKMIKTKASVMDYLTKNINLSLGQES